MKATIYHHPGCGTSSKTLAILREAGADLTIIEYLKTPPSREELKRLFARAGMGVRDGLRARETLAGELGLTGEGVAEDRILDAMMAHPILIERPLVETEAGVALCRPQDKVHDLL